MAAEPLSLLEFVHELLADPVLRGRFAEDPRGTLHAYGLGSLGPADVHDALVLAQDNEITDFHAGAGPVPAGPSWDVGDQHGLPDDTAAFGHGAPAADAGWDAGWASGAQVDPWSGWSEQHAGHDDGGYAPDPDAGHDTGLGGFGEGAGPGSDAGPDHDAGWPDLHHG